jgi:hypothetical protein
MSDTPRTSERQSMCSDCGGYDIEWMYKCHTHGVEYCRGCECPYCAEEDYDDHGSDFDDE